MTESTAHRAGVYGWSAGTGGVHQHRIAEPLRVLGGLGVNVDTGVQLDDEILSRCDTVLADKLHDERNSHAWELLAKADTHRLILDVDDWMWAPDWAPFKRGYTPDNLARLFRNVELAHVVTTPTEPIAQFLERYNSNVWVVPNTVPAWLLDHTMPERSAPTVGYQGSSHHVRDWPASQQRQLARFLHHHPDWHAHLYGQFDIDAPPGRVTVTPWISSHDRYYRTVSMDVGIGPLRDTPFNRAKSSLRAVEYAALGIVAVLPDLAPYRGWVEDGTTGRLVRPHQTLGVVLHEVAADQDARLAMAAAARQRARQWTTEAAIGRWVQAWNSR